MIKKLLPVILLLVGAGAGVGAGLFLRPPPPEPGMEGEMADDAAMEKEGMEEGGEKKGEDGLVPEFEYIKMSNQFVVPVVQDDQVASLIVMSLSLEVLPGQQQMVFSKEPKLRDSFLQVMFDHANYGGFDGMFTDVSTLETLRNGLREVASRDVGEIVTDVLITEIARQDY